MTVAEVWTAIAQRGIELSAEGNRLRYRARKGTLTAELQQALIAHRPPSCSRCRNLRRNVVKSWLQMICRRRSRRWGVMSL
jgi:hypothetical protein